MVLHRSLTHLGPYELIRPIGSGGMGVVYEGRHTTLGRRAAVKVLHAGDAATPRQVARFLGEGRAAAQVRHPHVVDVFDFGVDQGVAFLVMELVTGETLAQRLEREGPLPLPALAELLLPVVSAVAELHSAGIIHRDLKPANILLARDRSGERIPKVADFGVSRMTDGPGEPTDSRAVLGTFAYMAPEQSASSRHATELSDQYALGVILYESATGRKPFVGSSPYELLHAIMHGAVVPPSAQVEGIPAAFDALVLRALCRDPGGRFGCVDELGEALLVFADRRTATRWAGEFGPPTSGDPGESYPPVSSVRALKAALARPPRRPGATAALVGMAALVGGTLLLRGSARAPDRHEAQSASAPSAAPPAVPAPEALVVSAPPGPTISTPAPAPAPLPSAAVAAPVLARGPRPRPAGPAMATASAAMAPPAPAAPRIPSSVEPVDNGAPILDPR